MHRRQFGKRSLTRSAGPQWQMQEANLAIPSFQPAMAADLTLSSDDNFSIETMLVDALAMVFSFKGRINRMEYWCIGGARFFLLTMVAIAYYRWLDARGLQDIVDIVVVTLQTEGIAYYFAFFLLSLCGWSLEVRRLHDRDVSAYWILTWFIPIAGSIVGICQIFANCFFTGTRGPNRFGY
ncbi:DUF805 domain-containing protein [Roseibium sp.]|uniref:DUF805 domain-containing protein n=1 Tax=Roseibium sp. TaxID=1936156 RepID=UPI003D13113E